MNKQILERCTEIARSLYVEPDLRSFHCTFLVHRRRIIAIGVNERKTHPVNLEHPYIAREYPYANISETVGTHSELKAIRKWRYWYPTISPDRLQVINIRLNRQLELRMSKPCQGCRSLLHQHGFHDIWYSTPEGFKS